jgi:hypothetical protein
MEMDRVLASMAAAVPVVLHMAVLVVMAKRLPVEPFFTGMKKRRTVSGVEVEAATIMLAMVAVL